jgi:hypothetical protein
VSPRGKILNGDPVEHPCTHTPMRVIRTLLLWRSTDLHIRLLLADLRFAASIFRRVRYAKTNGFSAKTNPVKILFHSSCKDFAADRQDRICKTYKILRVQKKSTISVLKIEEIKNPLFIRRGGDLNSRGAKRQ